jgi:hypothetical protein
MAGWSEKEDAIVRAGFEQDRSGAKVAGDLESAGFAARTRHAVLARMGQLGLKRRDANFRNTACRSAVETAPPVAWASKRQAVAAPKVASHPFQAQFGTGTRGSKPLVRIPESRFTAGASLVRFLDRTERQCGFPKWADGTPLPEKMVCGAPKQIGATYCPDCMARAYRPVPKQDRKSVRRALRRAA